MRARGARRVPGVNFQSQFHINQQIQFFSFSKNIYNAWPDLVVGERSRWGLPWRFFLCQTRLASFYFFFFFFCAVIFFFFIDLGSTREEIAGRCDPISVFSWPQTETHPSIFILGVYACIVCKNSAKMRFIPCFLPVFFLCFELMERII
jgi:hypothetical protein